MPSTWPSHERLGRTQYRIVMSLMPAILTTMLGLTFHGFALICQYLSSTVQVLVPSIFSPQRRSVRGEHHLPERNGTQRQQFSVSSVRRTARQMPRRGFGETTLIEITIEAVERKAKSGLCEVRRNMLVRLHFLRYTPFGLLNTFFLCRVPHPHFTESVHQLTIGWVKLQGTKPGLTGC